MFYVVIEIILLLLLAVLLGTLVGWLLFKAGRRTVTSDEWDRLERERHRLRSEWDAAKNDQEILLADRDRAFAERDAVLDDRDRLEAEHRTSLRELQVVIEDRDNLAGQRQVPELRTRPKRTRAVPPEPLRLPEPVPPSEPIRTAEPPRPPAPAHNGSVATRPQSFDVHETDEDYGDIQADDLQQLPGVGPEVEELLHRAGVRRYSDIADLDDNGIDELQARLPEIPGRIRSHDWVLQAELLRRRADG